jgi:hypothetical protein
VYFPVAFVALWLVITTILALLSGWFRLEAAYPNRAVEPILRLRHQAGAMGPGVNMTNILSLSVCPSGFRVGISRLFAPFCRDFFVPWEHITVTRETIFFWRVVRLQFGDPEVGTLTNAPHVASRLARAAGALWPEPGPVPEPNRSDVARRLLGEWLLLTCMSALFFILAPLAAPKNARPPIAVAILFPAIVLGVVVLVKFLREKD